MREISYQDIGVLFMLGIPITFFHDGKFLILPLIYCLYIGWFNLNQIKDGCFFLTKIEPEGVYFVLGIVYIYQRGMLYPVFLVVSNFY
jgi:hypothetical protein